MASQTLPAPPDVVASRLVRGSRRRGRCLVWGTGRTYGTVSINGVTIRTHRAGWIVANGPIAPGMQVCHRCDNPACIRPSHLFLGDRSANMRDMVAKGRHGFRQHPGAPARGERVHGARLTADAVREIRAARRRGETVPAIAMTHGVRPYAIEDVLYGRTWAWVVA